MGEIIDISDLAEMSELLREMRECRANMQMMENGWQNEQFFSRFMYLRQRYMEIWQKARDKQSVLSDEQLCMMILKDRFYIK